MPRQTGDSAVIVPVPDLDPLAGPVRDRYDPAAAEGVPAHVTIGYPFLPLTAVDDDVVAALTELVAAESAPVVTFAGCRRFPGVLWLDPQPADPFVRLTRALVARWPEAPPYGGRFGDDVVPHLTLTSTADLAAQDEVERDLAASLPVRTTLTEAVLLGFDGARWTVRHRFPFR